MVTTTTTTTNGDFHDIYVSLFVRTGFKRMLEYSLPVLRFKQSLLAKFIDTQLPVILSEANENKTEVHVGQKPFSYDMIVDFMPTKSILS